MNEYLKQVNSLPFYLIVGGDLLFILIMCVVSGKKLPGGDCYWNGQKSDAKSDHVQRYFFHSSRHQHTSGCDRTQREPWSAAVLAETFRCRGSSV